MTAGSEAELIRLMTAYDNSHEPKPSFNHPATVYGLVIPFMTISYVCVVLRIYTRIKLDCLGWDDLFVVLFRISATIGTVFLCLSLNSGFGEHILTIGYANIVEFQKKFYVCLATYTVSTTLVKLCLLSQYLRIFEPGTHSRLLCWIGLAISAVWGAAFSFCALFPCFPVSGFWDWAEPAHCYGFGSKVPSQIAGMFAGHTGSNAVLDAMVLAIPVPLYFKGSTAWRQRLGVGILLLLGLVVNLLSIWRLQSIVEHKAGTHPVLDPTWYGPRSIILAALEVDLASICASIPTFWPVLARFGLLGTIFVTQEVHITRQHRRISCDSEDSQYGLRQPSQQQNGNHLDADAGQDAVNTYAVRLKAMRAVAHDKHYQDDFVLDSVIPPGVYDKEIATRSQVKSDGQQGFERERERLHLTIAKSDRSSK
ncbi:hypothetical protein GGS23DRAFT_490118 [Durotheca rogersii]|uniref:uncharacterized protein n=1 Tax=Durotheca rogersii TaxID=419775 RepID=UPI002220944E|nr:uncharacterized protein GGS23DRAFT_490118 [Durotheca rogersii]KAI5864256.1 hypothetical protein GGS23DRAFT_490118 [Durotheca rogersii]